MIKKNLVINGIKKTVVADSEESLANVIRQQLGLTGTKVGCGEGQCGCCNVILDGKLVRSCVTKMAKVADGAAVTTIEGIGTPQDPHPLQVAWMVHGGAQCGFCTPGFIVSSKALLDEKPQPTREDIRQWFQVHRNACRCTGYKQLVDAVGDAAKVMSGQMSLEDLSYKLPADGVIWGGTIPRPSALAKVTGTLDYGADLGLKLPPGSLHLALVQADVSHANIKSIDTSEAEKMPGVFKVVTHKDIKGKNRITGLITFPTNLGDGWDRPILCDEKVFQYGDAIAIVCADTKAAAEAAAAKVKVDLEKLPAYMSAPAAMAEDAMEIHPGTPNIYFTQNIAKGDDTGPIFDKAAVVVEDDFFVGRQPHMPMEPDVGFAYQTDEGKLCIHSKSIGLNLHAAMIAPGLGVELENLVMVQNPAGGTFGYKFSPTMEALVGAAALATGKPVFLRYDYHQQMTYTGKRSPFFMNMKFAADNDGKLLAMETDWSVDHGPYSEFGDLLTLRGAQYMGAGYDIPAIRGQGRTVCTNHAWGSAFRAYGSPQSEFASEVLMDELAEKLGVDPLELRYKNVYRPGATTPTGQVPEVFSLPEMIEILKPKYEAAKAKAKQNSTAEVKRGVGVSIGIYGCGLDGPDASAVKVGLNPDGTVTIYSTWEDHGQGADMGALGTAHQGLRPLGLKPDQIKLVMNDTSKSPDSGPSGGSRQQVVTGRAIQNGCEQSGGGHEEAGWRLSHLPGDGGRRPSGGLRGQVGRPGHALRRERPGLALRGVHVRRVHVRGGGGNGHRQDRGGEDDPGGRHRQGEQPPGHRRPALRRHGPGHRPGAHRGLRGHRQALHPDGGRLPLREADPRRYRADLRGDASSGRALRRGRGGRASADQPARGDHQRHLQRLRGAHHPTAGPARKGAGRPQGLDVK